MDKIQLANKLIKHKKSKVSLRDYMEVYREVFAESIGFVILKKVNDTYDLDLSKQNRDTKAVLARAQFSFLADAAGLSKNQIGNFICRDRSTIYNTITQFEGFMLSSTEYKNLINEVNDWFYSKFDKLKQL